MVSGHPEFVFAEGVGDSVEEVRIKTSPGDYIFVPPFVPHREENPGEDEEAVVVIARSTQEAIVVNLPRLYALDPATGEPPRGDWPAATSGVAQEMIVARIRHGRRISWVDSSPSRSSSASRITRCSRQDSGALADTSEAYHHWIFPVMIWRWSPASLPAELSVGHPPSGWEHAVDDVVR